MLSINTITYHYMVGLFFAKSTILTYFRAQAKLKIADKRVIFLYSSFSSNDGIGSIFCASHLQRYLHFSFIYIRSFYFGWLSVSYVFFICCTYVCIPQFFICIVIIPYVQLLQQDICETLQVMVIFSFISKTKLYLYICTH